MKKNQFITLLVGVVGGLLFALGMCMCLLPEWNAFAQGVAVTAVGGVILAALGIAGLVKNAKNRKPINWKIVGKVLYGGLSALVMGIGMCLIMVWQMMLPGIIVGVVGIIMLICLLPMCLGFQK
ncbi:MAG: hypothetical protein K2N94_08775 [Lachnospiraceae bacterium]|nr:hypothetical protein [Lachnospiraceae bacterium]